MIRRLCSQLHVSKILHSLQFFFLIIDQGCNLGVHFHRAQDKLLTPLQASDPGGTITMVTPSGKSFTQQMKTDKEGTAVQETNPATRGQIVFMNFSIPVIRKQ